MLLYADENFPRAVTQELRRLGHDVLTAEEDGRANRRVPDESVLDRSVELGRAILRSTGWISSGFTDAR